jgi:hypothetical protein
MTWLVSHCVYVHVHATNGLMIALVARRSQKRQGSSSFSTVHSSSTNAESQETTLGTSDASHQNVRRAARSWGESKLGEKLPVKARERGQLW